MKLWNLRARTIMMWMKGLPRVRQSTLCIMITSAKEKKIVVVIGDSTLRGTQGPIS